MIPLRLVPLLDQLDHGLSTLSARLVGLTDEEWRWEPVPGCWSVRQRDDGTWHRDRADTEPEPPPFTTIAWRLSHLTESLALRADWTTGSHSLNRDNYPYATSAGEAVGAFAAAGAAWRAVLLAADDAVLDTMGYSQLPTASDPENVFWETVWWENQELLHHGAEIALLRDLWRATPRP